MPATKSALRGSQSAVMPRNLYADVHKVLCLPRNRATCPKATIHYTCHQIRAPRRSPPWPKYCTCHEICTSKQSRSDPLHLSRKIRLWTTKTRGLPCACHEKSPPCRKMRTAPQRERSRWKHPPLQRACAVEMHLEEFERHECTVNSSELAAHARAAQRSKHSCLTPTVRTPI